MKIARFGDQGMEVPVLIADGKYWDLRSITDDVTPKFLTDGLDAMRKSYRAGGLQPLDVTGARWGAPVSSVPAVICVGQNYAQHAAESGAEPPREPIVFLKTPNTVAGPNDPVVIPPGAERVDWEVELGIVVGAPAYRLQSPEEAIASIAGFVAVNDLSERSYQIERSGGQWSKGKCLPGFLPTGPWLATPDELNFGNLRMRSWVNGQQRQDATTTDMIFDVPALLVDISHYMRLEPGTIICTGTPQGVALSGRYPYLRIGDVCEIEIEGLGKQRQQFTAV